ncbi:hypothetical protein [Ravibacter arvi]|uniref:helix-turn-helix transcriptional regulator n=1 Tax=Ravibacter arvi TaxID=2051041 RepID=UPI0031EBF862
MIEIYAAGDAGCIRREAQLLSSVRLSGGFLFDTLMPRVAAKQKKKKNPYLQIRLLRLQANAASYKNIDFERGIAPVSLELTKEAIRLCMLEKNDLLLADTYFDMAELYNFYGQNEEYLTMLARAFEIADKIGIGLFPENLLYHKLGGMSKAAYGTQAYRECVSYGRKALGFRKNITLSEASPDVFLFDLIGASYKKMGRTDSSVYFYSQLLQTLEHLPSQPSFRKFWTAIARGNIGENFIMKGDMNAGEPLLREWLAAAIENRDQWNVCLSRNALAQGYYLQRNYREAARLWKEVYMWSTANKMYEYAGRAATGLASVFREEERADSAYFYYAQAYAFRDSVTAYINRSGLRATRAKVRLDHLQLSLESTTLLLKKEKENKRLILLGIALLAVIAALGYSRQQLKIKNRLEWTIQKKKEAETEVTEARRQIKEFVGNLREKNELIESLRKKVQEDEAFHTRQDIFESLDSYTLVSDEEWIKFRGDFSRAYPLFLTELAARLPQLTPAEERLSILIFLGLTGPQIAATLGIGRKSVTRARHRLARRLDLPDAASLDPYMATLLKL